MMGQAVLVRTEARREDLKVAEHRRENADESDGRRTDAPLDECPRALLAASAFWRAPGGGEDYADLPERDEACDAGDEGDEAEKKGAHGARRHDGLELMEAGAEGRIQVPCVARSWRWGLHRGSHA